MCERNSSTSKRLRSSSRSQLQSPSSARRSTTFDWSYTCTFLSLVRQKITNWQILVQSVLFCVSISRKNNKTDIVLPHCVIFWLVDSSANLSAYTLFGFEREHVRLLNSFVRLLDDQPSRADCRGSRAELQTYRLVLHVRLTDSKVSDGDLPKQEVANLKMNRDFYI